MEIIDPKHQTLPCSYLNLGNIYAKSNFSNEKALESYEKAIKLSENLELNQKERNRFLASCYNGMSQIYVKMNKQEESLQYLLNSKEILEKLGPDLKNELAVILNNLGNFYEKKSTIEDLEKALGYHTESISIKEELDKNQNCIHLDLAESYLNRGEVFKKMGLFDKALQDQFKTKNVLEKLDKKHPRLIICFSNISQTYCSMNKFKEGIEFHIKSSQVIKFVPSQPNFVDWRLHIKHQIDQSKNELTPQFADNCKAVGIYFLEIENLKEAEKYLFKSKIIYEIMQKDNETFELAKIYEMLAYICEKKGETDKCREYMEKSNKIKSKNQ